MNILQPRSSVVIVKDDNVLLMLRRKKPNLEYFVIPGGGIERNETAEEAAIREIKEELSIDVKIQYLIHEDVHWRRRVYYFFSNDFVGDVKLGGEESEICCDEDYYEPKWVSMKEFVEVEVHPTRIKTIILEKVVN